MFDEPADLPELREHIRARRPALACFMEKGALLSLDGDLLRVIPRNDIYIRYLNDNRASIGELARELYGRDLRVVVELEKPDQKVAQKPEAKPDDAETQTANTREPSSTSVDPAEFVARIVEPGRDSWLEIRAIKDRKVILQSHCRNRRKFKTEVRGAAEQGADIYFGVAARGNDKGGKLDDCQHLAALFSDIDFKMTPEPAALELLERFALKPSAIVATGGGLHVYWMLIAGILLAGESVARIGLLLRKLTVAVGGDLGAAEPARVLRIPGTQNHKYDPPRTVQLRHFDPTISYSLEQIEAALAGIEDPRARASSSNGSPLNGAPFELPNEIGEGERNPMLFALARSLHHKLGSTELLAVLRSVNATRCKPPLDDAELEQIARNASVEPDRADFNNGGPQTQTAQAETFLDYHNVGEVRDKLASFDARLRADISAVYETDYVTAATALEHFEPAEFLRLVSVLKGKGVDAGRWERTAREYGRRERARIAEARKTAQSQARTQARKGLPGQGEAVEFNDSEPSEQPVDGLLLVEDLAAQIRRFIVVDKAARVALVLWVLFTYLIDVFDFAPRLAVRSPEMRCGKSTLLDLLTRLTWRALPCSNISPSAIYRTIDAVKPTLLMDELDAALKRGEDSGEEQRGILNSGHSRALAFVIRLVPVGEGAFEPRRFSTFTPISHALIGRLPDTLADRSIPILMKRKLRDEKVERLGGRHKKANEAVFLDLRRRIARWTQDHRDRIAQADSAVPEALNDREMNNWTPLLQIADTIGPEWGVLARTAAETLAGSAAADGGTVGVLLLGDLRDLFRFRAKQEMKDVRDCELSSAFIIDELGSMESKPWSEWGRNQKPITARQLSGLLSPFGVGPCNIRVGEQCLKGYRCKDFDDAFLRYLPSDDDSIRYSATTVGGVCETGDSASATNAKRSGSKNGTSAYGENECSGVADENPVNGCDEEIATSEEGPDWKTGVLDPDPEERF